MSDELKSGRRLVPRMALSLPGKFLGVQSNHNCIVTNLSYVGLLIAINGSLSLELEKLQETVRNWTEAVNIGHR